MRPRKSNGRKTVPGAEQLSLFDSSPEIDNGEKITDELDKIVSDGMVTSTNAISIPFEESSYITVDELVSYRSVPNTSGIFDDVILKENYLAMKLAFYGAHSMESLDGTISVPHEMLANMTRADRVALYIGIGQAKLDDHNNTGESDILKKLAYTSIDDFGELISGLVAIGYKYHGTRVLSRKLGKIEPNELKASMQSTSDIGKTQFLRSMIVPYRQPGTTGEFFDNEFRDPHPENKPDFLGIDIYRLQFSEKMAGVYARNMKLEGSKPKG